MDDISLLVNNLSHAQLKEEEEYITGQLYMCRVWLADISQEISQDEYYLTYHIQKYTLQGKWYSEIWQKMNLLGVQINKVFGKKKKSSGTFIVELGVLNGKIQQTLMIETRGDSPDDHIFNTVGKLIHLEINKVVS